MEKEFFETSVASAELGVYDESSILALADFEAIRQRPDMYVGDTSESGLHRLLDELLDNALDECAVGAANSVLVFLGPDGSAMVSDNGRGIPSGLAPGAGVSALELAFTRLHAGAKFSEGSAYRNAGGLHGVGLKCVNALSSACEVEVLRDGGRYRAAFSRGSVVSPVAFQELPGSTSGTSVRIVPDATIFERVVFDADRVASRLAALAYLNPGIKFRLEAYGRDSVEFVSSNGITDFVRAMAGNALPLHPIPCHFRATRDTFSVDVAMQFCNDLEIDIRTFANNIPNTGGEHMNGFKTGVAKAFNQAACSSAILKEARLKWDDVCWGLRAVVAVSMQEPRFASQTKETLVAHEILQPLSEVVQDKLALWFSSNPKTAKKLLDKAATAMLAREGARRRILAMRKAKSSASALSRMLYCADAPPHSADLFIISGRGLDREIRAARNPADQAVLALRSPLAAPGGKRNNLAKLLSEPGYAAVVSALDVEPDEENGFLQLGGDTYRRVIVLHDGSAQGARSAANLLAFLATFVPSLMVVRKSVFVAMPLENGAYDASFVAAVFAGHPDVIRHLRYDAIAGAAATTEGRSPDETDNTAAEQPLPTDIVNADAHEFCS